MSIELLDTFPAELEQLAREAECSSFYHTGVWIESLRAAFPQMTFRCLVAAGAGGAIEGYLPFFKMRKGPCSVVASMPFGTYGGPVVRNDEAVFRSLVDAYLKLGRAAGILEASWTDFWNRGYGGGFQRGNGSTHIIDLRKGFDSIWKDDFDKSKRRQSRKAEREGLSVVEASSSAQVAAYCAVYRAQAGRWRGSFLYPDRLFDELTGRGSDSVRLFLVVHDGEVLGGHLNFYHGDMVIAWNGVTRPDNGGRQASTFLYAFLIRRSCERGYLRYNLGGSLGKDSLEDYKAALGGGAYAYAHYRRTSRAGSVARAVRRFIPRRP